MGDLLHYLGRLWDPTATPAGAFLMALVLHLWRRFRNRLTVIRWSSQVQPLAMSAQDDQFGTVEVRYNGDRVEDLYMVGLQLQNDTMTDVSDLEVQIGFRDGTTFLSGTGKLEDSLRALEYSDIYSDALNGYLQAEPDKRDPSLENDLLTNRFYNVPAFNRGASAEFAFLVHAPHGITPTVQAATDHEGVKFQEKPPKPELLGARQDIAGWVGLLTGLAVVTLLPINWSESRLALIAAFLLGAVGILDLPPKIRTGLSANFR